VIKRPAENSLSRTSLSLSLAALKKVIRVFAAHWQRFVIVVALLSQSVWMILWAGVAGEAANFASVARGSGAASPVSQRC